MAYTITADRTEDLQVDAEMLVAGAGAPARWTAFWVDDTNTKSGTTGEVVAVSFPFTIPAADMAWAKALDITCFPSSKPGPNDKIQVQFTQAGFTPRIADGTPPGGNTTEDTLVSPETDITYAFA